MIIMMITIIITIMICVVIINSIIKTNNNNTKILIILILRLILILIILVVTIIVIVIVIVIVTVIVIVRLGQRALQEDVHVLGCDIHTHAPAQFVEQFRRTKTAQQETCRSCSGKGISMGSKLLLVGIHIYIYITYREVLSPKLLLGIGASKTILMNVPAHVLRVLPGRDQREAAVVQCRIRRVPESLHLSFMLFVIICWLCMFSFMFIGSYCVCLGGMVPQTEIGQQCLMCFTPLVVNRLYILSSSLRICTYTLPCNPTLLVSMSVPLLQVGSNKGTLVLTINP